MKQTSKFLLSISLIALSVPVFAETQTLIISEGERIEATISKDMMNRLAVANDRIVNVFGDEGTFVTQTDAVTGQVFIKPTIENGVKPLSISIITENNVTQDLNLTPTESEAATIILKNLNVPQETFPEPTLLPSQNTDSNASYSRQLIQTLKKAALSELDAYPKKRLHRKNPPGFKLAFDKTFQTDAFSVSVWQVKKSNQQNVLEEKDFYQREDLALSLRMINDQIYLYALQRK